jgi:hypothetical protein
MGFEVVRCKFGIVVRKYTLGKICSHCAKINT